MRHWFTQPELSNEARVIAATVCEAPYVLDGLLHHTHQTDLRIAEHYTDTAGATDHVFGLCHLLGFRFAPRIKDLKDRKLYAIERPSTYPLLESLIGDTVEAAAIVNRWQGPHVPQSLNRGRNGPPFGHLAQTRSSRCRQCSVARPEGA